MALWTAGIAVNSLVRLCVETIARKVRVEARRLYSTPMSRSGRWSECGRLR
jgi:hypothetical protein